MTDRDAQLDSAGPRLPAAVAPGGAQGVVPATAGAGGGAHPASPSAARRQVHSRDGPWSREPE